MKTWLVARAAIGLTALMALPAAALAQAMPAAEIVGQPVQVTTNGITNTVYLDAGGTARIVSAGGRTVAGTWTAANGQLCLNNGAAQECWPYTGPFQAGQPEEVRRAHHYAMGMDLLDQPAPTVARE